MLASDAAWIAAGVAACGTGYPPSVRV